MSRTNRNFLIAYVVLVVLPIAGLFAVIKHGRSLEAPISVDGVWRLDADLSQIAALPCGSSLASTQYSAVTISQSGKNFTLSLNNGPKATASGVVEGTTLKASVLPSAAWASQAGCGSDHVLTLTATVDPKSEPRTLAGLLTVSECSSCAPVELRAVREIQGGGKKSH
jgi:hypothetical protein